MHRSRFSSVANAVVITTCLFSIGVAALVLLGWGADFDLLKSFLPNGPAMKANSAICFLLLGLATLLMRRESGRRTLLFSGLSLVAVALVISLTSLGEYLLHTNIGFDEYIFRDRLSSSAPLPAGRPTPISLLNFIFLSIALYLMNWPTLRRYRGGQFFVLLVLLTSVQSFVGHVLRLHSLEGAGDYGQMEIHTAAAFIALSVGILASRPKRGYMEAFGSDSPGADMARRMLFAILICPLLVRWLAVGGFDLKLYDQDFADLLQVVGGMFVMGGILIWSATVLYHSERAREEARTRAEAANRAKTNFLANISHEIRTPLGAVLGFSELLANEANNEKQKGDLTAAIRRNGDQLLRLIDDILDISKIDAGSLNINKERFLLQDFLDDLQTLARLKCEERELAFEMIHRTALPEHIVSDRNRLRQVLLNVIGNAVKFNRERGKVTVTVEFVPETKPRLRFGIRDEGAGITKEAAARLFQPFSQGDTSATRKFGGSGLGLALSRKITRALGGDLHFQGPGTAAGNGSLFCIQIDPGPLDEIRLLDMQASTLPRNTARTPLVHELRNVNILLVEDSPDNRVLVSRFLKSSGATVEMACDGLEGVQKALHGQFDIVLMDLQMPNLDGYDAIKRLRGIGYQVPIVALTAHAFKEDRDRCLKIGFNEHLTKPVNKSELIHTVEAFVHDTDSDRV